MAVDEGVGVGVVMFEEALRDGIRGFNADEESSACANHCKEQIASRLTCRGRSWLVQCKDARHPDPDGTWMVTSLRTDKLQSAHSAGNRSAN